ncbi:hypothetical protein F5141DRAFT_1071722 [Pisolithus sp. B1]|nr:hypothetical protein F5141DRAFT_1071722 [Pisolithus sp. B1]
MSSRDDSLAAYGHESVNPKSRALPSVIEPYANCKERVCPLTFDDGNQCLQPISCGTSAHHFAVMHGIRNLDWDVHISCAWQGCERVITRRNFTRHVREVRLEHNRRGGHAAESRVERTKKKHEAHGDFFEIGRKASEPRVVWQGVSVEEREDVDSPTGSAHTERSEPEPVDSSQDKVEVEQEDIDRRIDFFQLEHDDPLPDVSIPGPAFWGVDANPFTPCTGLEARKISLISRLLTPFRRRKLPQCSQEGMRTYPVAVHAAREKTRLLVAPQEANKRVNQTDQSGHGNTLYQIDSVTSAADTRDERMSDDGCHGSYCVCYFKPLRSPEYRRR